MEVLQIQQNLKSGPILPRAGYQLHISAGAGAELRYSPM